MKPILLFLVACAEPPSDDAPIELVLGVVADDGSRPDTWLPADDDVAVPIRVEAAPAAAGAALSWTVAGGSLSGASASLYESTCSDGPCAVGSALLAGDGDAPLVSVSVATPTASGSFSLPVYGAPVLRASGSLLWGEEVTVEVEESGPGSLEFAAYGDLAWDEASRTVSAGDTARVDDSLLVFAWDEWGQSSSLSIGLETAVDAILLSSSTGSLPATVASDPFVVTATADAAAVGATLAWTVSGGSISPSSDSFLAEGDGASASATVVPTLGQVVVVTATAGGVVESWSATLVEAPVLAVDSTQVVRGTGTVVCGDVRSDVGYSLRWDCPTLDHEEGGSCDFTLREPVGDVANGACTVTAVDDFGQRASTSVSLVAAEPGELELEISPAWIPADGASAAILSLRADGDAVGAEVELLATGGELDGSPVSLQAEDGDAVGLAFFTSEESGDFAILASSGGATATASVRVAGPPTASATSLTVGAEGASLVFTSDGVLETCGYSGAGWTVSGASCAAESCAAGELAEVASDALGSLVILTLEPPAAAAWAWCEDSYGQGTLVSVSSE